MNRTPLFRGCGVALATPFRDGHVDFTALERLVDYQLEGGTKAIIACGTTGEPATMTPDERESVIKAIVKRADGKIPVIAGTGTNCTQAVIDTAKRYEDIGVVGQLVVTPYYNRTTQEGLYRHFITIAESTSLPMIIYNVPSRTTLDISPETLSRLAEHENIIAVKESSYDVPFVMEKLLRAGARLTFYSGNDEMTVPELALGFEGLISVTANLLPRRMSDMVDTYLSGDHERALGMQLELLRLMRALFVEVSPIPLKYAMSRMGLCENELRLPLVELGENNRALLDEALLSADIAP